MRWFIHKCQALSAPERWLVLEAVACLLWVRVILALFPLATALQILRRTTVAEKVPAASSGGAEEIKRALYRAAHYVPFKALCLQQAFAASLMLRRRGLPAAVHFGVRGKGDSIVAHAWSVSGESPITGTELADQFVPIAVFDA